MIFMMRFLLMNWRRGDVVLCKVPMPSTQLQQFKIRPAIVVSADLINQISDDLMVVPCTSNTRRSLRSEEHTSELPVT